MSKIWIVCQKASDMNKEIKVMAFTTKDAAAQDCAARMVKAPGAVQFWIEPVEFTGVAISDLEAAANSAECLGNLVSARLNG